MAKKIRWTSTPQGEEEVRVSGQNRVQPRVWDGDGERRGIPDTGYIAPAAPAAPATGAAGTAPIKTQKPTQNPAAQSPGVSAPQQSGGTGSGCG